MQGFSPARVSTALRAQLADSKMAAAWLAFATDAPIGYLLVVYAFSLEHLGLTAGIDEFFVVPENRHGGFGTDLLRAAERAVAAVGCRNVSLQLGRGSAPRLPRTRRLRTA